MRWRIILFERPMSRFLADPVSVRGAVGVIVSATAVIVIGSAALMSLLDHREYHHFGRGMWWALQTVTTVGYGDVTPRATSGRIVASVVMFAGIALLSIVTAAVTSSFVQRAQQALHAADEAEDALDQAREDARFDDLAARLERVETMLRTLTKP
jgi:voltage-gated potassium channel